MFGHTSCCSWNNFSLSSLVRLSLKWWGGLTRLQGVPKEEGEDKWQPQETCRGGGDASAWDSQIIFDVVINKCFRKTENVSARKKTSSLDRSYKNCLSAYIDLSRQNNRFLINRAVCVILSVCFCEDFPAWIYFLCTNTLSLPCSLLWKFLFFSEPSESTRGWECFKGFRKLMSHCLIYSAGSWYLQVVAAMNECSVTECVCKILNSWKKTNAAFCKLREGLLSI